MSKIGLAKAFAEDQVANAAMARLTGAGCEQYYILALIPEIIAPFRPWGEVLPGERQQVRRELASLAADFKKRAEAVNKLKATSGVSHLLGLTNVDVLLAFAQEALNANATLGKPVNTCGYFYAPSDDLALYRMTSHVQQATGRRCYSEIADILQLAFVSEDIGVPEWVNEDAIAKRVLRFRSKYPFEAALIDDPELGCQVDLELNGFDPEHIASITKDVKLSKEIA